MINNYKKHICVSIIIIVLSLLLVFSANAKTIKCEYDRINTLILLGIIEDGSNLDSFVTRAEFSKILVKSSKDRKKVSDILFENVCNDVKTDTPYAAYIKKVIDRGDMFLYLGGLFKPNEYVTYNDLTRACLSLLSYSNEDFRGNQVIGRNLKFESLSLNLYINKNDTDYVSKMDIINAIYNTLKEKVNNSNNTYGKIVFDKLIIDSDNEINATEYIDKIIDGPYFVLNNKEFNVPFEINKLNFYLNGKVSSIENFESDVDNFGYGIYYINYTDKFVYSYTEREDVEFPVALKKGYIYNVYYSGSNMNIPYRIDIDNYKYSIESENAKFVLSAFGNFRVDDYVVVLYNKMNDITTMYMDSNGKTIHQNDETEPYNGSIISIFKYENIKSNYVEVN